MRRKNRVWSRAVIREQAQHSGSVVKAVIPARRAIRSSAPGPSRWFTREASWLEDQRIMGVSRVRSAGRSARSRTSGRRR